MAFLNRILPPLNPAGIYTTSSIQIVDEFELKVKKQILKCKDCKVVIAKYYDYSPSSNAICTICNSTNKLIR